MMKMPLLLLPGTLCTEQLWAHQIENLSDIAEVKVGDLTTEPTIQGMAKYVLDHAPERFFLAGLSLGGIVAIEIMRQAPERVLKLALLDTTANPPRPEQLDTWTQFIDMSNNGKFLEVTKERLLPHLIYQQHPMKERLSATIIEMAECIGKDAYINQVKAVMTKPNGFDVLPNIQCSTLLLVGREDALCTVRMHEEMKREIPHADLVIIEDCGHLSSIEQPETVTKVFRKWLTTELDEIGEGL
ncbi:alpha/beta hydrolase [Bacillus sp. REN10]|uniref:alpha/beta fold hydrolase n=1 Tax=Bacillus sp. REN10 TaxID=2782541 RepID=UPI00193B1A60|nr:alpha/beta hydrolase [Bacillus sp. REN10]